MSNDNEYESPLDRLRKERHRSGKPPRPPAAAATPEETAKAVAAVSSLAKIAMEQSRLVTETQKHLFALDAELSNLVTEMVDTGKMEPNVSYVTEDGNHVVTLFTDHQGTRVFCLPRKG